MPDADTVWLTPLQEMRSHLEDVGLRVRWQAECSRSHHAVVDSLIEVFAADASGIAGHIGDRALDELLAAHRLWSDWLRAGRVRKFAFVAEKTTTGGQPRIGAVDHTLPESVTSSTAETPLGAGTIHTALPEAGRVHSPASSAEPSSRRRRQA